MQRSSKGQFLPGQTGNPGGRPPIPEDVKAMLKDLVPDSVRALHAALNGDDERLRLTAAQTVLDRVYGKAHVSASIETTREDGPQAHLAALVALAAGTEARLAAGAAVGVTLTHDPGDR